MVHLGENAIEMEYIFGWHVKIIKTIFLQSVILGRGKRCFLACGKPILHERSDDLWYQLRPMKAWFTQRVFWCHLHTCQIQKFVYVCLQVQINSILQVFSWNWLFGCPGDDKCYLKVNFFPFKSVICIGVHCLLFQISFVGRYLMVNRPLSLFRCGFTLCDGHGQIIYFLGEYCG